MFDLGSMLSVAWDIGKDALFGSPAAGPPGRSGKAATSGLFGSGGGFGGGFIDFKKGAGAFLESQGRGPGGTPQGQQPFQGTPMGRPRPVSELTRGQAVGRVQLSEIQQRLYSSPEVRRAAQMLQASQNDHMRNLRAATGVEETIQQGKKTIITDSPELTEIKVQG